jgi:hypothetical protein
MHETKVYARQWAARPVYRSGGRRKIRSNQLIDPSACSDITLGMGGIAPIWYRRCRE